MSETLWCSDVSLIGRKQKIGSIISKTLNGSAIYCRANTQCNQILTSLQGGSDEEAVSDQNMDIEDVENNSFENMFEMANMSQILNVLGNELWRGQAW